MTEVFPGVYSLPVPLTGNPLKELNCYILKGRRRNLVVDVGFDLEEGRDAIKAALAELGCCPEDTDVYITHAHEDHLGALDSLLKEGCFTHAYMGAGEAEYYNDIRRNGMEGSIVEMTKWAGFMAEQRIDAFKNHPAHVYTGGQEPIPFKTVVEGDVIDLGGFVLQVYDFPGHTPGLTALYEKNYGLLFCGDHILAKITPNITFWQRDFNALGSYLKQLRRASTLRVSHTFSAHRYLIEDVYRRIEELLLHHERRLAEVERILAQKGSRTAYQVAEDMKWDFGGGDFRKFPITQKHFAAGEAFAHLEHLWFEGRVERVECEKDGAFYYTLPRKD